MIFTTLILDKTPPTTFSLLKGIESRIGNVSLGASIPYGVVGTYIFIQQFIAIFGEIALYVFM